MDRRDFLQLAAAVPTLDQELPKYRVTTPFQPGKAPMPGIYPGKVVRLHSPRCIDELTGVVNPGEVKRMINQGMRNLTGASSDRDAWAQLFSPADVVGIKVNCSGAPQ